MFYVLTHGSLIIFWVQNEKVNIQHLFCCPSLTDVQYLWLKKITTIECLQGACMATARQCDGRRKISASKRWLFVKCKYLEAVEVENMEEPPKCIVEHPGFQAVCLNYWVLRAAWQYKQQHGASAYEESDHKKSRHIAYRQLVRWYWGSLGRDTGVTLPSLIPVQLSAYDLISRSLKGWRMRWSSQDSIVQMNKYMIYCK